MKALSALVCFGLLIPVAHAADSRAATVAVPAAVVCGRGMTPQAAITELNNKLSDEKAVEVSTGGINLVVRGPFTVSAPVLDGFSMIDGPIPVYPHGPQARDEIVAPAPYAASACVTVSSLGPTAAIQPAPAGPYHH